MIRLLGGVLQSIYTMYENKWLEHEITLQTYRAIKNQLFLASVQNCFKGMRFQQDD